MKKLKYLLVIPLMLLFSTGCSYKELNDIAIASSLGIDYENNKYTITAEVLNLNKKDEGDVTGGSILYYGEGKTIAEAIRNIYFRYPKLLHLGHLRLIVLGKNTIEEKTDEIFDYFLRSPEAAKDPYILVNNKGSAKEIINPEEKNEETFNAKELISNLESNQLRQGTVTMINLEEFLSAYLRDGIDPIIPTINMDKEKRFNLLIDYKKAARTIYLNKSCFNGLYRVNKKGEFNVPFNKNKKVNTYDGVTYKSLGYTLNRNYYCKSDDLCIVNEVEFLLFDKYFIWGWIS